MIYPNLDFIMKVRIVKIIFFMLLVSVVTSSCSIFGRGRKDKSCMCPTYKR